MPGGLLSQLDALEGGKRQGGGSLLSQLDSLGEARAPAAPEDERSFFAKAYDTVFTPPEFVTNAARAASDWATTPSLDDSMAGSMARGFFGGAIEGAASLLTPGDVALTAVGMGPGARALKGIRGAAQAVEGLQAAADVGSVVRGVERMATADDLSEGAAGLAQTALGAAGRYAARQPGIVVEPPAPRRLPAGEGPPEPRQLYPGRPQRRLPAPEEPVIEAEILTGRRLPPGSIHVTPEGTAALPEDIGILHQIRESTAPPTQKRLGPGPRFVAGASEVADLGAPTKKTASFLEAQAEPVDRSGGVSTPAIAIEREIDPMVPAKEGARVKQYSGDPNAVEAPILSNEERTALEQFRNDLSEMAPQKGRLLRDSTYAHGAGGAPILEQLRILSEQKAGNGTFIKAIDELLAGQAPTNRMHTAALDSVRGYLEKRPSYVKPMFASLEAAPTVRMSEDAADEGFEAFAGAVDDLAADATPGELVGAGERGFSTPPFLMHTAGGLAGAAYGAATGEDTEDRIKRGLLFGGLGAASPALLSRGGGRVPGVIADVGDTIAHGRVPRTRAQGAPIANPMKDTEAFLGKFSPEVARGIEDRLQANGGFASQRRGTISNARLAEVADRIAVDVTKATPKGTAVTGEVITAYARAARQTQEKVNALVSKVQRGQATDADIVALEAARQDAATVLQSLMGMRAEAGRSLASFRFLDNIINSGDSTLIRNTATRLRGEAQKFADDFAKVGDDPLKQYDWLKQQTTDPSWGETLRSYFYGNILSGPKTHERNILGNISNLTAGAVSSPLAVVADLARSKIKGEPRTMSFGELGQGFRGAAEGAKEGVREFGHTFQHGISRRNLQGSIEAARAGKLELPKIELKGGLKNPWNWPGRTLDATDAFFRNIAQGAELHQSAYTAAKQEGLSGQRLADRARELRTDGGMKGEHIRAAAEKYGAKAVFQEEAGPWTQWLSQIYDKPGGKHAAMFVLPFLKTPANVIRQGFQASPAGFASKAARSGGRVGAQAQGKAAMGTAAAGMLAWMAASGRLSGNGPSDPKERAQLMETGWRPNSIKVGDQWMSYQVMQPISVQASIIANAYEGWQEKDGSDAGAFDTAVSTMARSANSFLDQSFLSGAFDFLEALKDPERSVGRVAGRTAQGLVPFVGAARAGRDALDPVVRQAQTIKEHFTSGLPGLSQSLEPRLNTKGEPITREGSAARRALDPFNTSSEVNDPIAGEMRRLGVAPTSLGDKLTYRNQQLALTKDESLALRQAQGQAERQIVERVMKDPRFQRASDEQKERILDRAQRAARQRVNDEYRRKVVLRERRERR